MSFYDNNGNFYPNPEVDADHQRYSQHIQANFIALNAVGVPEVPISVSISGVYPMYRFQNTIDNVLRLMKTKKSVPGDKNDRMVLVWDIGEITLLPSHYIKRFIVGFPGFDVYLLEVMINRILMKVNFSTCKESEIHSLVNIKDAIDDGTNLMRILASNYDALQKFYNEMSDVTRDYDPIINYELVERCDMIGEVFELYKAAEKIQKSVSQRWKNIRDSLDLVNKRSDKSFKNYKNVVLCEDGIAHGVAQLLISGMSKRIPIENIYSTCNVKEESVFQRIQKRFGDECVLVYITSKKEVSIPEKLQIPIWKILAHDSFDHLHTILRDVWLR